MTSCCGERTNSGTGGAFFQITDPAANKAVKATIQIRTNQAGKLSDRLRADVRLSVTKVVLAIAKPPKLSEQ
jgi:hypothetical protein